MNTSASYAPLNVQNDFAQIPPTNEKEKLYQNDNFYVCQPEQKFEPKYRYDEKNYYSNIGNMPAPQVPVTDSNRATRNVVYSNIEPPVPIPVPIPVKTEKDIIYSNIQWSPKPENTYCNLPSAHNNGSNFYRFIRFSQLFTFYH